MNVRRCGCGALFILALLTCGARAGERVLPLAVREGQCDVVLSTGRADDKFCLMVGSLASSGGPYKVTVATEATTEPARLSLAEPPAPVAARPTRAQAVLDDYPAQAEPPRRRDFFLFVKQHEFHDPASYVCVTGELQGVGRHCQVYVDRAYPNLAGLQPTVDDLVRTFDREVYPKARQCLGQVHDVDRDGRFTILLTPWLSKLADGKVHLGGFVRGSDFYRDLDPPFGNRCDMMYLNTDLVPGPHLRTLLAHEYTHAIIFSEHVFAAHEPGTARRDEESWLNEGLAHLAEDMHGYGWSNLDYRISAFLSAPEAYQLVVPDYYDAGLWRSHGHRGAAYLFLRWCADRNGQDLMARLIRTNLCGLTNLESATATPFAELFRGWSAGLVASEGGPTRRLDLFRPLTGRLLCGPRHDEVPLANGKHELKLSGTSVAYLMLHSPAAARSRLTVAADVDALLQVTLLRLPAATTRLSLRAEPGDAVGTIRLILTAHDAPVTLEGAAWERLVPTANIPEDTSYRPDVPPIQTVRAWFGDPHLQLGETRTSPSLPLPRLDDRPVPLVFKVTGTDAAGHHVTGWTVVPSR